MTNKALPEYTHQQWREAAARILADAEIRLFIDGDFRDSASGGEFETIDPANREVIAAVVSADENDVDAAVQTARRAPSASTA